MRSTVSTGAPNSPSSQRERTKLFRSFAWGVRWPHDSRLLTFNARKDRPRAASTVYVNKAAYDSARSVRMSEARRALGTERAR